jgi:hypothetical protein
MIEPQYHTLGRFVGAAAPAKDARSEELSAAYQRITQLENALDECREYFDARSDVIDGDDGSPRPNAEMRMLSEIDDLLANCVLPPFPVVESGAYS